MGRLVCAFCLLSGIVSAPLSAAPLNGLPLAGTEALTMEGDIAAQLVAGVDRFLLRKIDASIDDRAQRWQPDLSSPAAYEASLAPQRNRLAEILGVRDARLPFDAPALVATTDRAALVGEGDGYRVFA
ncbi:MAG: hypothetical protein KDA41_02590, partial [Planctomycetales bacterium]|nr:hypothetical protein [Planctomycetales bacterium]